MNAVKVAWLLAVLTLAYRFNPILPAGFINHYPGPIDTLLARCVVLAGTFYDANSVAINALTELQMLVLAYDFFQKVSAKAQSTGLAGVTPTHSATLDTAIDTFLAGVS